MHQDARELRTFLLALAANPFDADTHKVLADWYEDHGEPELADEQRAYDATVVAAETRLREIAEQITHDDYEGMVKALADGDDYGFTSDSYTEYIDDHFWEDLELVAKKRVAEKSLGRSYCSC